MIAMIVAVSKNNLIGGDNKLPWHIPEDLAYFKKQTSGHTIVMGRKTYDSIGRPLPNRKNIVLTRSTDLNIAGVTIVNNYKEILELALTETVFIIGGGEIYNLFIDYADKLFITQVDLEITGDTSFPLDATKTFEKISEIEKQDLTCPINYTFTEWHNKK